MKRSFRMGSISPTLYHQNSRVGTLLLAALVRALTAYGYNARAP